MKEKDPKIEEWVRKAKAGDPICTNALVTFYEPILENFVKKYKNNKRLKSSVELDDLMQQARLVLLESIHKYNPEIKSDFKFFMLMDVRNSLFRYATSYTYAVSINTTDAMDIMYLNVFATQNKRRPNVKEVKEILKCTSSKSEDRVKRAIHGVHMSCVDVDELNLVEQADDSKEAIDRFSYDYCDSVMEDLVEEHTTAFLYFIYRWYRGLGLDNAAKFLGVSQAYLADRVDRYQASILRFFRDRDLTPSDVDLILDSVNLDDWIQVARSQYAKQYHSKPLSKSSHR